MNAPGYWLYETSGVLQPAVRSYLRGDDLSAGQIAALRAYLRQWIYAPVWEDVAELRASTDGLTSRAAIAAWLDRANELGIDPL
ncbi:MAG TPA: hypothetical protein VEW06_06335 [Xanthobacteraceae bacterium]|nr:hypothetical protein [Xanthobacteraceae bacterium]